MRDRLAAAQQENGVRAALGAMTAVATVLPPGVSKARAPGRVGRGWVYLACATLAAAVCTAAAGVQRPIVFPLDDAYITLHNAQVLLSGHDANYGVPALVGATSLVHLLLVAGAALVLPPLLASTVVGGVAAILYVLGLLRMAFVLGAPARMAVLVVLLGCLTGYASFQLFNGLETGLAMAAVAWAFAFAAEPVPTRRLPLLCGVLPLVRPELALLSAILMLRQGGLRLRGEGGRGVVTDLAICVAAALPCLAWQWATAGAILLNTAGAKAAYFAGAGQPLSARFIAFCRGLFSCGLLPAMAVWLFVWVRRVRRFPMVTTSAAFVLLLMAADVWTEPGAFYWNHGRYAYVLVPALLAALVSAACRHKAFAFCLALLLAPAIVQTVGSVRTYLDARQWTLTELAEVAQWSRAHLPSDARILIHDAGYMAYATNFRLIDLVGLKTPEAIAYHQRYTRPTGGTSRDVAIDAIARRYLPDYAILLHDREHFWSEIDADLVRHGWRLDLLRRPTGQYGYFVYHLTAPLSR